MHLWSAEWLKTRKSGINQALVLLTLLIMLILVGHDAIPAMFASDHYLQESKASLPFPQSLLLVNSIINLLGPLLMAIFVANSVGSEYGLKTWKMVLPRYGDRVAFLVVKIVVSIFVLFLWCLCVVVFGLLLCWVGTLLLQIDGITTPLDNVFIFAQFRQIAFALFQTIFYGAVTLFFSEALRSTAFGILSGFVVIQALTSFISVAKPMTLVWPVLHLQNIFVEWVVPDASGAIAIANIFGVSISPGLSLSIVLGYIFLSISGTLYLFKVRDIVN